MLKVLASSDHTATNTFPGASGKMGQSTGPSGSPPRLVGGRVRSTMAVSFWLPLDDYTGIRNEPLQTTPTLDHTLSGKKSFESSVGAAWKFMELPKRLFPELEVATSFDEQLDTRKFPMLKVEIWFERETMLQTFVGEREQARPEAGLQATWEETRVREADSASDIFWESPTLEELARSQNVQPITDVQVLFGTWPGDEDDGFEAAVDELRHPAGTKNDEQS